MTQGCFKILKRAICASLCYGMIFTYPSWTLFGRIAHANPATPPVIVPTDSNIDSEPAPAKPAPKPSGGKAHTGGDKPLAPKDPKKTQVVPVGSSCSDDSFYLGVVKGQGDIDVATGICGSKEYLNAPVSDSCWKQYFTLLGAADANAYAMSNPDRPYATASAADAVANAKHFTPSTVGSLLARNENKLTNVLSEMSKKENLKESNNQECCRQLVQKAKGVADYIVNGPKSDNAELDRAAKKKDEIYRLVEHKRQLCENGHAGAVVVGHEAPPPPPKKKKSGLFWGILIAIGVALLIWALTKNKHKKAKPRPTEKPKPCKGKKCGGGGGSDSGGSDGGSDSGGGSTVTGCATGNCGNTTAGTTGEEPPVTTGTTTYPATTGDDGREVTTGGTSGGTYPNDDDNDPGRDNTTGGTGTATGSTTADDTTTSGTTNTGGDTGNTFPGGDDGDRDTGGSERTLIK